jgi:hypothetical protein
MARNIARKSGQSALKESSRPGHAGGRRYRIETTSSINMHGEKQLHYVDDGESDELRGSVKAA